MAPSTSIVALFLAFALVASAVQPSEAIRFVVQAASSTPEATAADPEAPRKPATAPAAGQLPGFPFPLFPLPGGAPPAGQVPAFPFPLFPLPGFPFPLFPPLFPLPGGGFPFPLFPPLFPLPGAPAAAGGQFPGFPFPLFPLPSIPGFPPVNPRPVSRGSPPPSAPTSTPRPSAGTPPPPPSPTPAAEGTSSPTVPPPQVTDCLPPLMGLTPCMDYLTNTGGVSAPPSTCCDRFKTLVNDTPICLCHGLNGDIDKIMPGPMDFTRMMSLPATCGVAMPLQTLAKCSTEPVPPLLMPNLAPASAPSPDSSP